MITLILSNLDNEAKEDEVHHEATDDTFEKAALLLLAEIYATYESIMPEIFEGLSNLQRGDTVYRHLDFSCPEEQFKLTRTETKEVQEVKAGVGEWIPVGVEETLAKLTKDLRPGGAK